MCLSRALCGSAYAFSDLLQGELCYFDTVFHISGGLKIM